MTILYLMSGIALVAAFTVVIIYYFSPKRKDDVEAAKYEMLKDHDRPIADDDQENNSAKN